MRGVRAFSSSARQARQALFEIKHTKPSEEDKAHAKSRKRLSRQINPFIARDAKVIRSVFYCGYASRQKLSEFGRRITTALAKLQDPNSFRVQDITFSQLSALPTISYPPSLTIIDLCNPLGVPPDTPKPAIPPIHDPSLVAQALSEAGLTGSFAQVDRLRRRDSPDALGYSVSRPWPHYRHVTRGGFIHPPRLNIDADDSDLGRFTLTLPGSTIPAFYDFLANFHERNPEFRQVVAVVALWARSHDLQLNAETVALMVMASMQGEAPLFGEGEKRGYANVEHKVSDRWHQTIAPVQIDHLKDVPRLDRGSVEGYIFGFFRHWTNAANSFYNSAFTVRKGRMKQRIPREYISDNPQFTGGYAFSINQIDDLTEDFPPWRHELLVIQDPFLFTHNHAAHLSFNEVEELIHQLEQTYELMHAGSPLAAMFGPHAAPPDSAAEAKILEDPLVYAPAIGLLRADRIPHTSQPEQPEQLSPRPLPPRPIPQNDFDPRLRRAPWTRRAFHSSCVSLGGGKRTIQPTSPKPVLRREKTERVLPSHKGQEGVRSVARSTRTPTPPRPVARWEKQEEPDEDQAGWGLNDAPVREPTFWRPGLGPLRVPVRTTSTSDVPPARATKAGVAYKSASAPLKKGFHTSAVSFSRKLRASDIPIGVEDVSPSVHASRTRTLEAVQDAIQREYGAHYSVALFGSTRYGISSPSSDLDLVILDPKREHGYAPRARRKHYIYNVKMVAHVLRRAGFKILEVVDSAAVPIVKFKDPRTGHLCDINVNDRLGLLNSDLIKHYCRLNPVLVDMIMFIKAWAKPLGLNNPGSNKRGVSITFSSYALVMMTIGFLQHRGLLPNLQEGLPPLEPGMLEGTFWLQQPKAPKFIRCDVRYNVLEDWTPPEDVPARELLRDWFNFWAVEFDIKTEMMSIRHGGRLLQSSLDPAPDYKGLLWNIDPFIRTKNLTQNLSKVSLTLFKFECHRSALELGYRPDTPKLKPEDDSPTSQDLGDRSPGEGEPAEEKPLHEWLPADMPLSWRANPRRGKRTPDSALPPESSSYERRGAVRHPAAPSWKRALPSEWTEPLLATRDAPPHRPPHLDAADQRVLEESSDEQALDSNPEIRVDTYRRLIAPEKPPPPPPPPPPEEPEVDEVGWGFKSLDEPDPPIPEEGARTSRAV